MIIICWFDILGALLNMLLKLRCRRPWIIVTLFVLMVFGYAMNSYFNVLSEYELQASSWEETKKMFGNNQDTVLASYENLLPRAGNLTALDGVWQNVSGTRSHFFVFSAYYERRVDLVRSVRVIGATATYDSDPVWCRLWYNTEPPQSVSILAQIKIIRENWNLPYSACFVLCPLDDRMTVPHSVSIVRRLHSAPSNHLLVIDNQKQHSGLPAHTGLGQLSVCVKPIHSYYETLKLVEFLELHIILGVEHFTMYDRSASATIRCILKHYVDWGIVSVLPWKLNMVSAMQIHSDGIFASLNDCLYRNMYRYSNVAMIDLDEYIIPKQADTLVQLIEYMDDNFAKQRLTGSYVFQNAFFYQQRPDDPSIDSALQSKLLTISKTKRNVYLQPHNARSKYVCKPEVTAEVGNHFVWEFIPNIETIYVKPEVALSHHYRKCESACEDVPTILDRTAHRYKDRLEPAVLNKWRTLQETCDLEDIFE